MSHQQIEPTRDGSEITDEELELLYELNLEDCKSVRLPTKSKSYRRHVSRGAFEAVLLCTITILSSLLFFTESRKYEIHLPTVVPKFAQVREFWNWEPDHSFVHPNMFGDPELRDSIMIDWLHRLIPLPSRGFVEVVSPEDFNLAPPRLFGQGENPKYMIAVFHQLHCLSHLIRAFSAARLGDDTFPFNDHHLAHCFDYIRQGLLCAADPTLEGNNTLTDGAHHVCNNYGALKDWATENAATNVPQFPFIG